MNIFSNLKLFAKFTVHTLLFILFVSILFFSQVDIFKHMDFSFALLFLWLFHVFLNKNFFFSYVSGKINGKEASSKFIISIVFIIALITTITLGKTMMNGDFIPFITGDIAYNYHKPLAFVCILLLFIHLFQNKRALQFIWKKIFR